MKIGVFDSGIGGKSVVNAISRAYPEHEVIYLEDSENIPYGNKSVAQLNELLLPFIVKFVSKGCEVIVLACNTATTNSIEFLRASTDIPIIGIEPMVKPASMQSKSGVIAICATPATLKSKRYAWLKQNYAKNLTVIEPDCSDWAALIESSTLNEEKIAETISAVCDKGADVIVLGCTHYHWIENEIKQIANIHNVVVLQPESAIVRQLARVIEQLA